MLGPVSAAQHSQPTVGGAMFSIGLGISVLTALWYRYLNRVEEEPKPPMGNMVWISFVACIFIGIGVWELTRALRIPN
jgi:formate/nitrite transporter FocA (FNT family)